MGCRELHSRCELQSRCCACGQLRPAAIPPCSPHQLPQAKRYSKNGTALAKVLASLLQFGAGLALGPDADGLLNLGDVPPEEWAAAAAPAPTQRHAQFDVQRLLDSGGWAGSCGLGRWTARRRACAWRLKVVAS